jgi:hypothetical protein
MKEISGALDLGVGGGSENAEVRGVGDGVGISSGRFGGVVGSGNGVASPEDVGGA